MKKQMTYKAEEATFYIPKLLKKHWKMLQVMLNPITLDPWRDSESQYIISVQGQTAARIGAYLCKNNIRHKVEQVSEFI